MTLTAGLDIGSLWTKAALVRDGKLLATHASPTGDDVARAAEATLAALGIKHHDLDAVVTTGAGKKQWSDGAGEASEVLCAARGAILVCPGARGVIDMGGESTRVVKLDERGQVLEYAVNEKCAAGTGVFLDAMGKAMGVAVDDMGPLSLTSMANVEVTSICVAFAESEVVSLVHRQTPKPDILRGIHKSIASRIAGLAGRIGLGAGCVAIGGLARNQGIVAWLEAILKNKLTLPAEPQVISAIGAALVAAERLAGGREMAAPARTIAEEQAP